MVDFPYELETVYNDIEITHVVVRKGSNSEKSLAFCDITLNSVFKVNNIEVRETAKGTKEILMPYRRDNMQPRYRLDFAHPVDKTFHEIIKRVLLFCYETYKRTGINHYG